jgi:hypothetical protein
MANITDKSGASSSISDKTGSLGTQGVALLTNDNVEITDNSDNVLLVILGLWGKLVKTITSITDKNGN